MVTTTTTKCPTCYFFLFTVSVIALGFALYGAFHAPDCMGFLSDPAVMVPGLGSAVGFFTTTLGLQSESDDDGERSSKKLNRFEKIADMIIGFQDYVHLAFLFPCLFLAVAAFQG